jgi:WD40 repeat protein
VLSVRWAQGGRLLLVNARPRVEGCCELSSAGETMAQAMRRPAPPLRTAFELLILDASTLETLSAHDGHHAFTTADAPFIVHADAWANSDIVASGGEDACVHVWHRSHGHQVARLEAHTQAVNAVAWSQTLRLMISASDDHTVVVWSCRAA